MTTTETDIVELDRIAVQESLRVVASAGLTGTGVPRVSNVARSNGTARSVPDAA